MSDTARTPYALRTTDDMVVIFALDATADSWLQAVRHVRLHLPRDAYLTDVAPAASQDVAQMRASGGHVPEGRLAAA